MTYGGEGKRLGIFLEKETRYEVDMFFILTEIYIFFQFPPSGV